MTRKPDGFVNFVAWATLLAGIYAVAASLFGVIYLVFAGAGAKVLAYLFPLVIGGTLATAGFALMRGINWSKYIFLGLCVLAVLSLYPYLPTLLLLGRVGDAGLRASLVSMAVMMLFSLKWILAAIVATIFVFRHFRNAPPEFGPTLAEMTKKDSL